jgi:serine O-acetyltransferase
MKDKSFEELVEINCFSDDEIERDAAAALLEKHYCCQIVVGEMAKSVKFAHHARGCIIIAAKLCENVVIMQNVTIGTNMRFNKITEQWENVGNPILDENVIIADGAKILGPVVIGRNSVVGAGAIVTQDIPPDSIAYGFNTYKPKDPNYDYLFNDRMIEPDEIVKVNQRRIVEFNAKR